MVVRTIQLEWIFLQRVTWYTGGAFAGVEKMIRETFFASSFPRKYKNPLTHRRSSKYDADNDDRTGDPESSDIDKG